MTARTAAAATPTPAPRAGLCVVLHAHLPFVRQPESPDSLEERWLHEAIIESYVPLLLALTGLRAQGRPFGISLSVSPTLVALLDDPLMRARRALYLEKHLAWADAAAGKHSVDSPIGRAVAHYRERWTEVRAAIAGWQGDLIAPLRDLQNVGQVEILSCPATHGFLPLMSTRGARRAQIRAGLAAYTRAFGRRARGMWLPECGFDYGLDRLLAEEGIDHVFVDSATVLRARPLPQHGLYAPCKTPAGVVLLPRDPEASEQVWSAESGFPGHPAYREFHHDLGRHGDYDEIRACLPSGGLRGPAGIKLHRVTGRHVPLHEKHIYDPDAATLQAHAHARAFAADRRQQCGDVAAQTGRAPLVSACFDAELFGHWWYEGPIFLRALFNELANDDRVETMTSARALQGSPGRFPTAPMMWPAPATWGAESSSRVWLSPENAWLYRYAHFAEREMGELARRFGGRGGATERALRQAGRELLLLQSSDFAFMIASGSNPSYACRRFKEHFAAFCELRAQILAGEVDESTVSARENRAPIFPHLDVSAWA